MKSKIKKKCYVHNIFTTNHKWLVIVGLQFVAQTQKE